jgi:GntR family histidine utilization transcriptional repressor
VRAQLPNAAVRRHLQMPENEPCLVVMRRTWAHGRPVTFARLHHPGSRYELTGQYTPPGTSKSASDDVVQLEKLQR